MFSWGEDCRHVFWVKEVPSGDGVVFFKSLLNVVDLSAARTSLAFVKSNGNAFIARTTESKDGTRATGRQKRVISPLKFKAVSCGDDSVTLLSDCDIVYCVDPSHGPFMLRTLGALSNIPVSQVACGSQHSVALTKDGRVYTWGQGSRGQTGLGKETQDTRSPQHLRSLSAIPLVQVCAGGEHSFALSVSGGVFGWGRNDCGQLGLGDRTDRHTPASVHCLNRKKTVDICCGDDHTVILTKTGAVFTFGSGHYGQLGHNSFRDELRPRLVAELWGAKVTNVACGRHHTLVLTASKRVYSFGRGEQGQLGHGEESHPSVPLPAQLPQDATEGLIVRNIYAGRNYSFASCSSLQSVDKETNTDNVTRHCLDGMIDHWITKCDSRTQKKKQKEMFSSASCLNQSFLDLSKDKHFQTSPNYSGLNLSRAQLAFAKLKKKDFVLREVEAAVLQLLPSLDEKPVGVEGLRIFLLLNELLHVIQSTEFALKVATAIQRLSPESLQVLGDWWSSLSPTTMVRNVEAWKRALSVILSPLPAPCNPETRNVLLVLQHMYHANNRIAGCPRIPEKTFCLEHDIVHLLCLFLPKRTYTGDQPLMLCDFPFLMNLTTKLRVFGIVALQSQIDLAECFSRLLLGLLPQQHDFFELRLKRATLWEDTVTQLAAAPPSSFKEKLMVYLDEDPNVTHVYKKDLFHRVFNDIVSTQPGMFLFNDSKTLVWFPSKVAEEDETVFFFFGVLCGLALYNECIIHMPFPLALFKKLLDVELTLEDMKEFSSIGGSLQDILDYEDDVLENLYMDFLIHWDGTEVDLDPQNPGKLLTSQNKKEFVDAYVNHVFSTSVEGVFEEFRRGFFQVCEQRFVKLFRPEELQEVLVGKDAFDWAKLKQNTVYSGVYHAGHPTILMFWEVFEELTAEQRKDFIWFLTGFRRVPALGMDQIRMNIGVKEVQRDSPDQHYPESLTCYSVLVLPLYSTKEIMRDRLTEALMPEGVVLM